MLDAVANRPYRHDGIHDQNWKESMGVFIGKPTGEHIEQDKPEFFCKRVEYNYAETTITTHMKPIITPQW
jgi:hypothetical protein